MAKIKRHIDLELKAKLGAHKVPVAEGDWTAFEIFRNKRKKKLRGLIWLVAASLLIIGISGLLIWKHQETKPIRVSEKSGTVQPPQTHDEHSGNPEKDGLVPETGSEVTKEQTDPEKPDKGEVPSKINTEQPSKPNKAVQDPIQDPGKHDQEPNGLADEKGDGKVVGPVDKIIRQFDTRVPGTLPSIILQIPAPLLSRTEIPQVKPFETAKEKENNDSLPNTKPPKIQPLSTPSLAFGIVYGFGKPDLSLGEIDSAKTHRQYEKTLKESKTSSQVFRLFLQYEYRLKIGMEFGAGLQFSSISQVQKYNFEMRDVPWIDLDGTIRFYIPVPPIQSVTPTVFESRQNIYSASVPMSLGYAHTLGSNFRLGLRAQGSFGMNWSKDFKGLSPGTLSETSLKANVNPLNMSYGGGIFGEYFYLRAWSARLSLDWTAQNKLYKESNSFNSINRYYEFKLALVRYL